VEQLLKRFEALRSGGTVKVLAVDTDADEMLSEELPPAYQAFFNCGKVFGTWYGKPRGDWHPAMCFRLLGDPADIHRFMGAAEAAGKLLKGRLSQSHLVKAKEVRGHNGKAEQATWLISLFAAAAGKQLRTDGLAGGDWYLWHRAAGVVVAESTVERYRGPRPAAAAALAVAEELARSDEEPTAFAVLGDAVETSIALLHWLAERYENGCEEENEAERKATTTCQLLEELCSTAAGLEQAEAAWQRGGQLALAHLVGRKSAGSVNGSDYFRKEMLPEFERRKAERAMLRDRVSRFGKEHPESE
jgi:hypothetical protein